MADSPAKKLNFDIANKENIKDDTLVVDDLDLTKPQTELVKQEVKPAVAPGIKSEEADEPLLQENPQRFVLFPIKYHEVRVSLTRNALSGPLADDWDTDMADVQESRSFLLDCGRNRLIKRYA